MSLTPQLHSHINICLKGKGIPSAKHNQILKPSFDSTRETNHAPPPNTHTCTHARLEYGLKTELGEVSVYTTVWAFSFLLSLPGPTPNQSLHGLLDLLLSWLCLPCQTLILITSRLTFKNAMITSKKRTHSGHNFLNPFSFQLPLLQIMPSISSSLPPFHS